MARKLKSRVGERTVTKEGYEIEIIDYVDAHHITIKFLDSHGATLDGGYNQFKEGSFRNPYHPSVEGIGYLGEGRHRPVGEDGKVTELYELWRAVLKRCHKRELVCFTMDETWYNFQNFAEWYYSHPIEKMKKDGIKFVLCMDLVISNNNKYNSDLCFIIPEEIAKIYECGTMIGKNIFPYSIEYDDSKLNQFNVNGMEFKRYQDAYEYAIMTTKMIGKQMSIEFKDYLNIKCYDLLFSQNTLRDRVYDERYGEIVISKEGCPMCIIEYINCKNILIEFQDDYKHQRKTDYSEFGIKDLSNPFYKSVLGIAYIGVPVRPKDNREIYASWFHMIERTCVDKIKEKFTSYREATIADEWLCYQNYYNWYISQVNYNKDKKWHIEKDILKKGNKHYSPTTCLIVPQRINNLILTNSSIRGELPIGVRRQRKKYSSRLKKDDGKEIYLGTFDTPEEAFYAYKEAKEAYIKEVADEEFALGNIAKECRDALYAYEVEITD